MQLFCTITSLSGKRVPLILADDETTNNTMTPTQLRNKVSAVTKIPLKDLRLIFRGRMIKDDDTIESVLNEYKLENDSVLHCMGKPTIENNNNHSTSATETTSASAVSSSSGASVTSSTRTVVPPLSTSRTTNASSASAGTAGIPRTIPAMNLNDPLNKSLLRLRQNNPPSVYATGVETLGKVLKNITDHPLEEKYRKVKKQNAAFRKRLGGLVGGHDCMLATGFIVENDSEGGGEEVYKLHATAEKWTYLTTTAQRIVADATQQAKLRQQQQSHQPSPAGITGTTASTASGNANTSAAGGSGGGFGGGFPSGGMNMNMNDPNVQNMMSQVMNNPESLSAALQNPMVQQMMRNNPDISPSMRQDMATLSNNPAMLQQMTQRMQDPAVQAQMRQAMSAAGNGGGGGGGGGGMGNMMMPNSNATGAAPVQQQQQQRGNDSNQTEDEMIAEAIRRSLEDNM